MKLPLRRLQTVEAVFYQILRGTGRPLVELTCCSFIPGQDKSTLVYINL